MFNDIDPKDEQANPPNAEDQVDLVPIDTPHGNDCFFYSIILSVLLPLLKDDDQFNQMATRLFGQIQPEKLESLKEFLMAYDGTTSSIEKKGGILTELVKNLRNTIADHQLDSLIDFELYMEENETVESHAQGIRTTLWGGNAEIEALRTILQRRIRVYIDGRLAQEVGNEADSSPINLIYTSADGSEINNHYNYLINPDHIPSYIHYPDFSLREHFGKKGFPKIPNKYEYLLISCERKSPNDFFVFLTNKGADTFDAMKEPSHELEHGWKFEISIDDAIENDGCENLAKAWDLIIPFFFQNNLRRIKIWVYNAPMANTHSSVMLEDGNVIEGLYGVQAGKQITIYACMNEEISTEQWQEIFQELTLQFLNNKVRPSCRPVGSYALGNNPYISYRNDSNAHGTYRRPIVPPKENDSPYKYMQFNFDDHLPEVPSWRQVVGDEAAAAFLVATSYDPDNPQLTQAMAPDNPRYGLAREKIGFFQSPAKTLKTIRPRISQETSLETASSTISSDNLLQSKDNDKIKKTIAVTSIVPRLKLNLSSLTAEKNP